MGIHDETAKAIYLRGGSRKDVMKQCDLNTNQVSSMSNRLELRWSWPLENRISGVAPAEQNPAPRAARERKREIRPGKKHVPSLAAQAPQAKEEPLAQMLQASAPPPTPHTPAGNEEPPETIPLKRPPLPASPGFISERERRLKGLGGSRSESPAFRSDEDEFEKLIRTNLYG